MNMSTHRRPPRHVRGRMLVIISVIALTSAACGEAAVDDGSGEAATAEDAVAHDTQASSYPLTIENCDAEVTVDAPPERVLLLHSAPVEPLHRLGLLDRVIGKAGAFPEAYWDDEVNAVIQEVPEVAGDDLDASGHYEITLESVIAAEPDLVMSSNIESVPREGLADAGIPMLLVPSQCPGATISPDFDDVYGLVETYGEVFDVPDEAAAYIEQLQERVSGILADVGGETRTAAALFPTIGGGAGYAYGNVSMVHPQLESAGFENVFADVDERVFEVTLEEVIARDPDVLVLLHIDGAPQEVEDTIRALPGADTMTAVVEDEILVQLFHFSDPPTPLTVDGLERIVEHFGTDQ